MTPENKTGVARRFRSSALLDHENMTTREYEIECMEVLHLKDDVNAAVHWATSCSKSAESAERNWCDRPDLINAAHYHGLAVKCWRHISRHRNALKKCRVLAFRWIKFHKNRLAWCETRAKWSNVKISHD